MLNSNYCNNVILTGVATCISFYSVPLYTILKKNILYHSKSDLYFGYNILFEHFTIPPLKYYIAQPPFYNTSL